MPCKFPTLSLVVCFVAVVVLCALSIWQVERLAWKTDLQHHLDQAFAKEQPDSFTVGDFQNLQAGQVIRGSVTGNLDLSKAVLFHGRIQDGKSVMAVVAPLAIPSSSLVVAVEAGCGVQPDIVKIRALQPRHMTVTGILRQPRPSFAIPDNIPDKGEWWRMDVHDLSAYWEEKNMANGVLTAENTEALESSLSPCPIEKKLRNDHLSYAIFWFTMAGILAVIWAIRFLKPYLQSA
ncbi:MAG TPA: hypothetical protein DCM27_03135 [Rhodospirillaceae bacterium]|nr:hypothetical protein [Rhodospirillaceae bacterium]